MGGQTVPARAEIESIPVFARAGSIIPMMEGLRYASDYGDKPMEIRVFTGGDAYFTYYDEEGDGYKCEEGEYERIRLSWSEKDRTLTIGAREGRFKGMKDKRRVRIFFDGVPVPEISYTGDVITVKAP